MSNPPPRCTTWQPSTAYSTLVLPALWLTSATNPENSTVSYTYNADGTLASKTDANGNTETYTYDAYQRLTAIPDPSSYQGPFTGASVSYGGVGVFGSVTSTGGITNPTAVNWNNPFNFGASASIGTSLLSSAVPFQLSSTVYAAPVSLGNLFQTPGLFAGLNAVDPATGALLLARQTCDHF